MPLRFVLSLQILSTSVQHKEENRDSVTSIVVEQGCFRRELRITGNSNKLIYFRKITSRFYSTKLLQI